LDHERDVDAAIPEHLEPRVHLHLHCLLILSLLRRLLLLLLLLLSLQMPLLLLLLLLHKLLLLSIRYLLLCLLLLSSEASSLFGLQLHGLWRRRYLALHRTGTSLRVPCLSRLHLLLL
jgi:hypothetical protein